MSSPRVHAAVVCAFVLPILFMIYRKKTKKNKTHSSDLAPLIPTRYQLLGLSVNTASGEDQLIMPGSAGFELMLSLSNDGGVVVDGCDSGLGPLVAQRLDYALRNGRTADGYCCHDFVNEMYFGRRIAELNTFHRCITTTQWPPRVGDIVRFLSGTDCNHSGLCIQSAPKPTIILSLYGTGGPLAATTPETSKKHYECDAMVIACRGCTSVTHHILR